MNDFFGGQFFGDGFFSQLVVIDTHDGDKKRDERHRKQKEAKERLREQIRAAIEGPSAPLLTTALERVAQAGPEPLVERVDIDLLYRQAELLRAIREAAEARAMYWRLIDEDDEDVFLLL